MATAVNIQVTLDDKGVVTGAKNIAAQFDQIEPKLKKVGQQGNIVFTQLEQSERKAHDAAKLLTNTLGVEVPRTLEKIIARAPGVSGALSAMFQIAVAAAFAKQVIDLVNHFDEVEHSIEKAGFQLSIFGERLRNLVGFGNKDLIAGIDVVEVQQAAGKIIEATQAAQDKVRVAGLEGARAIRGNTELAVEAARREAQVEIAAAQEKFGANEKFLAAKALITSQTSQRVIAIEKAAAKEIGKVQHDLLQQQLLDHETEIHLLGKSPLERIGVETNAALIKAKQLADRTGFRQDTAGIFAVGVARSRDQIQRDVEQAAQIRLDGAASTAHGIEQIELQLKARLHAIEADEGTDERVKNAQRLAAESDTSAKIAEIHRRESETTRAMNEDAAVAILPPWERATAQVLNEEQRRLREQKKLFDDTVISEAEFAARQRDIIVETNAKLADDLASKLEQFGDAIGSGSIGKYILNNFKKMFYQVLANWIITTQQMGQATAGARGSGGGGGILGTLLGGLFGIGGQPGASAGPGGVPVIQNFAGGGAFGGGGFGGGGIPAFGAFGGAGLPPGIGDVIGLGGAAGGGGGSSSGPVVLSGVPGIGGGGGIGSLISGRALGGFGALAGVSAAGRFGGTTAQIGAVLAGLGITAGILGPQSAAGAAVFGTGLSPFIAPAAGALVGFGIGAQNGKLAGALSGAGTGALTGLLIAGPLGALIGGIAGLLGGLFGGIFGGSKRRKQANQFADSQLAQITKIEDAYKSFQLDFESSIAQLEAVRGNGLDQLRKLKGEGRDVFAKRLEPAILRAEDDIRGFENSRQRRGALQFGPPQFARGGVYTEADRRNWPAPGGGGWAILHPDERVLTASESRSSGEVHNHYHTWNIAALDSRSVKQAVTSGDIPRAVDLAIRKSRRTA